MIYQLMFAIITPALIAGAFAERMKFSAMLLFSVLWALLVYSPVAHMVWGVGGLLNAAGGGRFPTLDFAGGTVVHITSGVSALVTALYLGKRLGYPQGATRAAQHGSLLHRRRPAVGGLVRLQRGQRAGRGPAGHQRLRQHAVRGGGGRDRLGRGRVDPQRQAKRAGRGLRRGGWAGDRHPGRGLRATHLGGADRADRRRRMLLHGGQGEGLVRLRRLARRIRRAWRRRNDGRAADRHLRHRARSIPSSARTRSATRGPRAGWTAIPRRCCTS